MIIQENSKVTAKTEKCEEIKPTNADDNGKCGSNIRQKKTHSRN